MPTMDAFNQNPFSLVSLTNRANNPDVVPFVPGRLGDLGLFTESGVTTLVVAVERREGQLVLLSTKPRGSEANQNVRDPRNVRNFTVPHIPFEDRITADEVLNIRAFGTENEMQTLLSVVDERMVMMGRKMDATLEWHRVGAIKGQVLDADGSTVIHNLFTEFGISQPTEIDFDLDNPSPAEGAVRKQCMAVVRGIEDALGAAPYAGIRGFCGSAFFDDLVAHQEVRLAYERQQDGQFLRDITARRQVSYGGIMFEEYRGRVGGTDFIGADKVRFVPEGVPGLFVTHFAPADFTETVGTMGLPRYARTAVDQRFGRWVDLHMQTNPLTLCTRPEVLFRGKRT